MRWIPRLPGLGEWSRLVNWRVVQLSRLRNVEVITQKLLTAADVLDYGAEIVVCATGATWATDGLSAQTHRPVAGADISAKHLLTPELVMVGEEHPPGEHVLVYDCEGYFMGAGIAEKLALDGYRVELVTPLGAIAPFCDETLEGPLLRKRLHERGVGLHTGLTIGSIDSGGAIGETDTGEHFELEADAFVLVTQRLSNEALYLELRSAAQAWTGEGVEAVYRIGDCVAPRVVADAIFDGHRLAREIDAKNPALPLPHRRERPARGLLAETSAGGVVPLEH